MTVGSRTVTLGYRTAIALVSALVVGSVGGTSLVLRELSQIELALHDLSGLSARVDDLSDRLDSHGVQIVRLTESADVGWPAWPR